jgi:putative protease
MGEEKKIGEIAHYFSKIGVATIKLTDGDLKVGDTIHIKGHTSDFTQNVESIQIEHKDIQEAKKGSDIGIKVIKHTREHDVVYKVIE